MKRLWSCFILLWIYLTSNRLYLWIVTNSGKDEGLSFLKGPIAQLNISKRGIERHRKDIRNIEKDSNPLWLQPLSVGNRFSQQDKMETNNLKLPLASKKQKQ